MSLYADSGIILKDYKLSETDSIIVLVNKSGEQKRCVLKNARKSNKVSYQKFNLVDFIAYKKPNLDLIKEIAVKEPLSEKIINQDYIAYLASNAISEICLFLSQHSPPSGNFSGDKYYIGDAKIFSLTFRALRSIANKEHNSVLIVDSYILRAMSISGWRLNLDSAYGVENKYRLQKINLEPFGFVDLKVIDILNDLLCGIWLKIDSSAYSKSDILEAHKLIKQFWDFYTEIPLKSYRFLTF